MPKFFDGFGRGIVKRWFGSSSGRREELASNSFSPTHKVADLSEVSMFEQNILLIDDAYSSNVSDASSRGGAQASDLSVGCISCCRNSSMLRNHITELLKFCAWMIPGIPSAIQLPFLWYVFWEHVCTYGNLEVLESHEVQHLFHVKALCFWLVWLIAVLYYRRGYHSICPTDISDVLRYLEFFALSGLIVTLSANICSLLHTPAQPLYDLGFNIVPALDADSPWRPASDILAQSLPIALIIRCAWLRRSSRCQVLVNWLRCVALAYIFRALTVTVTSLPGPAPHCNNSETYHPPAGWHDIATRLGPMIGDYSTCGDLIFSGHTAFTNTTMLCLVKTFRGTKWDLTLRILGPLYVVVMATMALAGRKHYSVDIVVALLVSSLTFYRFQDGWLGNSNHMSLPTTDLTITRKDTIDLPTSSKISFEVQRPFTRQTTNSRLQLV